MPERIAIKVMSGSDLSFFEELFKQRKTESNQKAINLNADVFANVLYPDFAEKSLGTNVEVPVWVTVHGPRPGKPYRFPRSITKGEKYKNWRLNGAAVPDPDDEPHKFNDLDTDDVAVMEFHGDAEPGAVTMIVISAKLDAKLRDVLAAETPGGKQTMAAVSRKKLSEIVEGIGVGTDHPIRALLLDQEFEALLEEAQTGTEVSVRKLRARASRKVTKADIDAALERIKRIGSAGEALAHVLLTKMKSDGTLTAVSWTSEDDAAASWDFEVEELGGKRVRLDAKSTTRAFESYFFLSAAEAVAASELAVPYRIIRISNLTEDGAVARISEDINALAALIVDSTKHLPAGILPTGFSLDISALKWGPAVQVERPDEPE